MIKNITIKTKSRTEFVDITSDIQLLVDEAQVKSGLCHVYVPHDLPPFPPHYLNHHSHRAPHYLNHHSHRALHYLNPHS
ncbi:MAG: hypothetical protein L0922_07205, partial [Candidatus Mariimomonas ferrooxydans]